MDKDDKTGMISPHESWGACT